MPKEKTIESEVGGYISTLLRKHFGKGPTSIYVTVNEPFIAMHFRGFTTTMEKILLKQNEWKRVLETRNIMVNELKPLMGRHLHEIGGWNIEQFYVDWNLQLETGTFLAVMEEIPNPDDFSWPQEYSISTFEQELEKIHITLHRDPQKTENYWLNDRTLLIKHVGVLSEIEKALIDDGHSEILKFTKRPLERRLLETAGLEAIFNRPIQEIFLDWSFNLNVGYLIIVLHPPK